MSIAWPGASLSATPRRGLPPRAAGQGCPCTGRHAKALGTVSAPRLPAYSHLLAPRRTADGNQPCSQVVVASGARLAAQTAAPSDSGQPATTIAAASGQSRLGVRLRVRLLRQRPA